MGRSSTQDWTVCLPYSCSCVGKNLATSLRNSAKCLKELFFTPVKKEALGHHSLLHYKGEAKLFNFFLLTNTVWYLEVVTRRSLTCPTMMHCTDMAASIKVVYFLLAASLFSLHV
jgi:hypothetical protein